MKRFTLSQKALGLALLAPLFASIGAHAACDRPVDPKRVVIYAGMNESLLEIKAAEEAACMRGDSFRRLPEAPAGEEAAYQALINLKRIEREVETIQKRMHEATCQGDEDDNSNCGRLEKRFEEVLTQESVSRETYSQYLNTIRSSFANGKSMNQSFNDLIVDLAARKMKPVALILSGHSGGGNVWGSIGEIDFNDAQNILKSAYKGKEALLEQLDSILLWGCNTINPFGGSESWKNFLPNLKLLFGFQGSAPSGMNAASSVLLRNVLNSEAAVARIQRSRDPESDIKREFDALRGIEYTIGSAYVNQVALKKGWYYERTHQSGSTVWTSSVRQLVTEAECEPLNAAITADQEFIDQILEGQMEIPENTGSGQLREIYTRARRNENCRKTLGHRHSADKIGLVLFWNDVKKNGIRYLSRKFNVAQLDFSEILESNQHEKAIAVLYERHAKIVADSIARIQKDRDAEMAAVAAATRDYELYRNYKEHPVDPKKHAKETKRLQKRIRKLEKKLARGKDVAAALETAKQELDRKQAVPALLAQGNTIEQLMEDATSRRGRSQRDADYNAHQIEQLQSQRGHDLTTEKLRTNIKSVADNISQLSAASIATMGMPALNRLLQEMESNLEKLSYDSQALYSVLPILYDKSNQAIDWVTYSRAVFFTLDDVCMPFQQWHEYIETPTAGQTPTSQCF